MLAGTLDRRLVLERATTTPNELGERIQTWTALATVWGSKHDISDAERQRSAETAAEITTRFQIRYASNLADINPKDRLIYNGRTYDIWGVKEIGRRVGLEITATARADR